MKDKKIKVYVIESKTTHYKLELDSEEVKTSCPVPIELTEKELGDFVKVWIEWKRWQNILQREVESVLREPSDLKADGVDDFIVNKQGGSE